MNILPAILVLKKKKKKGPYRIIRIYMKYLEHITAVTVSCCCLLTLQMKQ